MKPPHQQLRVDRSEMKAEIVKKLGPEGSKQYFLYLSMFLNTKLSKIEFNKLCLRIVGRENIPLHNQFVHSILKNVCHAKVPPPKEALKYVNKRNELIQLGLSNGDIRPVSLQKVPTEYRNNKLLNYNNSDSRLQNGDLSRKPLQQHQVVTNESENDGEVSHHRRHCDVPKRLQDEAICSEDRREGSERNLIRVPLSVGEARKTLPPENSVFCAASSFSIGGLLDSSALRERMEKIVLIQGLKGVTMDCASLLNKELDSYLKGLISSGVTLVGTRLGSEPTQSYMNKHRANLKFVNGVNYGIYHQHKQGDMPVDGIQEKKPFCPVSLLDFKFAMELNPQQLGEDWPLLLEKICTHAFGEE